MRIRGLIALAAAATLAGVGALAPGCIANFDGPYTCEPGYTTCDNSNSGENACRINLQNDPNNCGACNVHCNGDPSSPGPGVCEDGGCPFGMQSSGGSGGGSGAGSGGGSGGCSGGNCGCNSSTCNGGCCSGNTCVPSSAQMPSMCGTNGNQCMGCSSGQNCINGKCALPPPPKLPEPLTFAAAALDNTGSIVVIGGTNASHTPSKAFYRLDMSTQKWTRGPDMANARTAPCLTVQGGGNLYAIGGFDASGNAVATIEQYDSITGTWSAMGTMQTPRGAMACGGQGQSFTAGGSATLTGPALSVVESDPGGGTWPSLPMPVAWAGGGSFNAGGPNLVVVGGAPALSTTEYLDNNTWVSLASLPTGRSRMGATSSQYMSDSLLLVLGGRDSNGKVLADFEMYDSQMHTWSSLPAMPTAREGLAVVASMVGPTPGVYALGGDDGATPPKVLDTVEMYTVTNMNQPGTWQ